MNSGKTLPPLHKRLVEPNEIVSLNALYDIWKQSVLSIKLPGYGALSTHPRLLLKLRGAIGEALLRGASEESKQGQPCPWSPPCANDVFYSEKPCISLLKSSQEVPKPFVLWCERSHQDLILRITIFGFAAEWISELRPALLVAVREFMPWAYLAKTMPDENSGSLFLPKNMTPVFKRYNTTLKKPLPPPPGAITLKFLTPIDCKNFDPVESPKSLISSLVRRVVLLARWQSVSVDENWRELFWIWHEYQYAVDDIQSTTLPRKSRRNNSKFYITGRLLSLRIEGNLSPLWPILTIGENTHCGRGTNIGLGKFELVKDIEEFS